MRTAPALVPHGRSAHPRRTKLASGAHRSRYVGRGFFLVAYGLLGACGGVVSVESGSNDGGADAGESVGMVPGGDGEAAPDSGTMGIDARSDDGGGCPHGRVLCNGVCRCLVTLASGGEPAAIAIDDTAVYWTSIGVGSDAGTVMTVPKTGGLA